MNGQRAAAEAGFSEGNRMVAEVIEKWPRYGRAHLVLATIHLGLGEPERARVELEAAEALDPDAPMLWAVWAQYHLAESDPVAAAARMTRAVKLDPDNWQLRLQAARVLQGVGDDEAAIENIDAALQLVTPGKRAEVRRFVERMMGPEALGVTPARAAEDGSDAKLGLPDPALMLGDPSNLRLRDPGQTLKLDLDE